MKEQKTGNFGIIFKDAKTKKQKEEKKFYTIVSCCVSAIFLITIFVPLLSNNENKASENYYKSKAFDLTDAYVEDEAEQVLLEMSKYSDIPQTKIAGGLFDKKQKEERQALDKKEGIPEAPDQEYKKARKKRRERLAKRTRGVSVSPKYGASRPTTTPGIMQKSSTIRGEGSGSGVGTTWTSPDKQGQKANYGNNNNNNRGGSDSQQGNQKDRIQGRVSGIMRAAEESKEGANSQNLENAMDHAIQAFTDPGIEAEGEPEENDAQQLLAEGIKEGFKKVANDQNLEDLKNEAEKAKERKEEEKDPCLRPANKMSFECYWGPALMKLGEQVVQAGLNLLQAYGQAAINAHFNQQTPTTTTTPDPAAAQAAIQQAQNSHNPTVQNALNTFNSEMNGGN